MKKKLIFVLIAVVLVLALAIPLASMILADNAPALSSINPDISPLAPPQSYTGVKFYGTDLTNVTTIAFADTNVTVSGYDYSHIGEATPYILATINVAAGTTHGPKAAQATSGALIGPWLYNGYSVAVFPTPPLANAAGVSLSIQACSDATGLVPISGPVANGQNVWYRLTLSVNLSNHFNFYGGQLSVEFPDNSGYHPTAGSGNITSWAPEIPQVSLGNPFSVVCPTPYVVNSAHLVGGVLLAETDYGPHDDNPTQIAGIQEGFSRTVASASVQITLEMVGSLEITKVVDLNSVPATGVDYNFSVTVTGTGGPYNHTFVVDDGVVLAPNPWVLNNLAPGYYNVVETSPAPLWTASGGGLAEVKSGNTTSSTITNDLNPGHLQVTKALDLNGAGPGGISKDFTLKVTGPSFPGPAGTTHVAHVIDGVINPASDSPWILNNLLSGNYTVSEETPGGSWVVTGGGIVEVNPGVTSYNTVTNDFMPGKLRVYKALSIPAGVDLNRLDGSFSVNVSGPGINQAYSFNMTDGVITEPASGYYEFENLIPGDIYTITETPGTPWTVSFNPANGEATIGSNTTVSVTVTNTYVPGKLRVYKALSIPAGVDLSRLDGSFTVHVSGPGISEDKIFTMVDGVITLPVGGYYEYSNLIPGDVYTITETPGTPWTVAFNPVSGQATIGSNTTVEVIVTNTYVPGKLRVYKALSIPAGVDLSRLDGSFTVHVSGPGISEDKIFTMVDGVITLPVGGYYEYSNLIPGDVYTITETPGTPWTVAFNPVSGQATIGSNTTVEVIVTNTYVPGKLKVSKALSIPAGVDLNRLDGSFTVHVSGPGISEDKIFTMVDGVITLPVGGYYEYSNLIPGDVYTITETPGTPWTVAFNPANGQATIGSNTTVEVIVTNTYVPGKLRVYKALSIPAGVDLSRLDGSFTVHVSGPGISEDKIFTMVDGVITLPVGGYYEFSNLIPGDVYTITETPGTPWTVSFNPANGQATIGSNTTVEVIVTNTYVPGKLKVSKALSIPAGVDLNRLDGSFTVHVSGPGISEDKIFTMVDGVITLPVGGYYEYSNLIPGDVYTITETPGTPWTVSFNPANGQATIGSNTTVEVIVTNTYVPGKLKVSKALSIPAGVDLNRLDGSFTVHVSGPGISEDKIFTMVDGVITLPVGGYYEFSNLIPGDVYTITETPGTPWTVSFNPANGQATIGSNTTVEVIVTNTYVPGKLKVSKALSIPAGVDLNRLDGSFTVHVSGPGISEDKIFTMVDGVITLPVGGYYEYSNLIPGDVYTITETPGTPWTVSFNPANGQATIGSNTTVEVIVTNTYVPGKLKVSKALSIPAGVDLNRLDGSFTVHVSGPGISEDKIFTMVDGVITLPVGGYYEYSNLIPGDVYTITETPGTPWTVAFNPVSGQATIGSNTTVEVIVTNTYVPGKLRVYKALSIPAGVDLSRVDGSFTVHVSGPGISEDKIFTMVDGVITLPVGGYYEYSNLIPGDVYTITETPGTPWTVSFNPANGQATIGSNTTVEVIVTNTYVPGKLKVSKALSIPAGVDLNRLDGSFTVHVSGPGISEDKIFTMVDGVITLPVGGYYEYSNLIPGDVYTITETPGTPWTVAFNPANGQATIGSNTTVEVIVTNTYVPGKLKVSKALSIPAGVDLSRLDGSFTVHVSGPGISEDKIFTMVDGVITLPVGGYYEYSNLIPGDVYTITETPGTPWTVAFNPANGQATIGSNTTVEVIVTNTYVPGKLRVYKALSIPAGVDLNRLDGSFTVHVSGPGISEDKIFTMVDGVITLPVGGYYEYSNLIPGDVYTITETPGTPWTVSFNPANGQATIGSNTTVEVIVTNTYVPGKLKVSKALSIPAGVDLNRLDGSFTVHVSGPGISEDKIFTMVDGVITLPVGGYYEFSNLIPGDVYTITETPGTPWTVSFNPANGQATIGSNTTVEVIVTNTYVPGKLKVSKALSIPAGVDLNRLDGSFTVHVSGPGISEDKIFTMVDGVITLPVGGYYEYSNLIPGDVYTITETPGTPWTVSFNPANGQATIGSNTTVEVIVTNTYVPGKLKVSKALSIPAGVDLNRLDGSFTVHVSGPGISEDKIFTMVDGVITLPVGGYYEYSNLIPGDVYTITETPGTPWTVAFNPVSGQATIGSNTTVEVIVTNTYVPGKLRVYKALSIPAGVDLSRLDGSFTVHIGGPGINQDVSFNMTDGVITAPASGYYEYEKLIPGDVYTITETPGTPWTVAFNPVSGQATIGSNTTVEVIVTNTYVPGKLKVSKALSIPAGVDLNRLDGSFTVHVSGPGISEDKIFTMVDGVITLPVGGYYEYSNLIPGDVYTITETPGTPWTVAFNPVSGQATIGSNTTVEIIVNNTYVPGKLKVSKALSIPAGVDLNRLDGSFTVHIGGPGLNQDISFTMTDGVITAPASKYHEFSNLIPGDVYTITETPGTPWTVAFNPVNGQATIGSNTTVEVIVTNTYVPGKLKVSKALSIPQAVDLTQLDGSFTVHIGGPGINQDVSFNMTDGVIIAPALKYYEFSNLIPGDVYTITETPGSQWTVAFNPANGQATIGSNTTVEVIVTNTYLPGTLIITKAVNLQGAIGTGISGNFTVTVTGTGGPYTHIFQCVNGVVLNTLGHENPWTLTNLIPGPYVVTESDPGPIWEVSGNGGVTVNPNGDPAQRTITNTLERGSLQVTKAINMSGASGNGISGNFTVTVSGMGNTYNHQFEYINGAIQISAGKENPWLLSGLTPGPYTVTESDPGLLWTVSGTGGVTVNPDGAPATSTITNTFRPGSLTLTKAVVIPSGVPLSGITGNFNVTVSGPYGYINNHTFIITNGILAPPPTYTLSNLVPGVYHVSETAISMWNVAISNVNGDVTVIPAGTATSTVTNTYKRPNTYAAMTVSSNTVDASGGDITVTVSDTNNGEVPLTNSHMHLKIDTTANPFPDPIGHAGMPGYYFLGNPNSPDPNNKLVEVGVFSGGDTNNDGIMTVGETWTWTLVMHVTRDTTFTVYGHGTDPAGNPVNYDDVNGAYLTEKDSEKVTVPPPVPATGTWGTGILIAALAGTMVYLAGRRMKKPHQI